MSNQPAKPFDLETIRTLIAAGYSFIQLRAKLKCNNNRLRAYMTEHGLSITEETNQRSNQYRQEASARARNSIDPGRGGDEAFAKLMRGQVFGQPRPCGNRKHAPLHLPHRVPGDDFSACGSSMLHSVGRG